MTPALTAAIAAALALIFTATTPAPSARAGEAVLLSASDGWFEEARLRLSHPDGAAVRAYVIDGPPRLVIDIEAESIALPGFSPEGLWTEARAGRLGGDWSRLILTMKKQSIVGSLRQSGDGLTITMASADRRAFRDAVAKAPPVSALDLGPAAPPATGVLPRIVLDPGHGGIDPGAVRDGVSEKDIALSFARELARQLRATGRYDVVLTRNDDRFVLLDDRVAFARRAGARFFLSLHANTESTGQARGATAYVSSQVASDRAAAALAVLENQSEDRAGIIGADSGDDVALALLDMARPATQKRGRLAAESLIAALGEDTGVIRSNPIRSADFRVLRAPDMPSVLLELGFLSDPEDRARMTSEHWRRTGAAAVVAALDEWIIADGAFLALMRQ